ncbi:MULTISPECIES: hypothetical protein [Nostoc]|uniref:Uncharacterized protein n=1 Tax=Nostoc paludosum FACHB-159 TaxID=2692908 RepID=A0ABR8KMY0_9NOSO|nr:MULTISPECIES: hypothetical protein [Nostoc]MBD2682943.1 hypothetical protein [Nostoc sp. FACHB-857]MBD2739282.1 hypothetical protein [Nostoc paludosum FACHB-159]
MDIQIVLNWTIQILVMGFVCLMVMDFVNGLFSLPYLAIAPVATSSKAFALQQEPAAAPIPALALQQEPVAAPIPEPAITPNLWEQPQLAQLPDPWELTTDIQSTPIQHQPVVLQLSTLKLLPPAAPQVQAKAATKKSTKSAQPKSTKTSKTSQPKTAVTPRKSRNKAVA